jgi:hypothetical protein
MKFFDVLAFYNLRFDLRTWHAAVSPKKPEIYLIPTARAKNKGQAFDKPLLLKFLMSLYFTFALPTYSTLGS